MVKNNMTKQVSEIKMYPKGEKLKCLTVSNECFPVLLEVKWHLLKTADKAYQGE